MNRIDRLSAITLLLQAKGRVRAKDLAAWFEVSERRVVRLRYHSYNRNEVTERKVEPQQLAYSS